MSRIRESDGSDSFETDSIIEDPAPTTIRIPNPKVFVARQSQWKGRRGKPRCDYCRTNNLKCDREQPICNHCSWSSLSDCKYTPLPTPAHRGIPRCDRCRLRNLKCDRNLPMCNNCIGGDGSDCRYTPKKRHKVPVDGGVTGKDQPASYGSKTAAFLVSDMGSSNFAVTEASFPDPASRRNMGIMPLASGSLHYQGEGLIQPDPEVPPYHLSSTRTSDDSTWIRQFVSVPTADRARKSIANEKSIDPWVHPNFCPLPHSIVQVIRALNALELPNRVVFDEALQTFLSGLSKPLQETAAFSPPDYYKLAKAIETRDLSGLSSRVRMWIACHHLRHGSKKQALVLVPKDGYHQISPEEDEKQRMLYAKRVEGPSTGPALSEGGDTISGSLAFERIPTQPQIYELLAYGHRTHGTSAFIISEVRRIGFSGITWPMAEIFIRLCPVCRARPKPDITT